MAYGYQSGSGNASPMPMNQQQMGQQLGQQFGQQMSQQNIQPLFPQPQGNVYNINSTLEVANVPVGAGVSVALCLPENAMYIKTMQNGNPLFYAYKIFPFNEEKTQNQAQGVSMEQVVEQLKICCDKIAALENQMGQLSQPTVVQQPTQPQTQPKNKTGVDWEL